MKNRVKSTSRKAPSFPKDANLVQTLIEINAYYLKAKGGYRETIYQIIANCYAVGLAMQSRPDQFERLKADQYWKSASRKLPNSKGERDDVMRWVVFFVRRPTGKNARDQVGKWAKVLSFFRDISLPATSVVPRLKSEGMKKTLQDISRSGRGRVEVKAGELDGERGNDQRGGAPKANACRSRNEPCETADPPEQDKGRKPDRTRSRRGDPHILEVWVSEAQMRRALAADEIQIIGTVTEKADSWREIKARRLKAVERTAG